MTGLPLKRLVNIKEKEIALLQKGKSVLFPIGNVYKDEHFHYKVIRGINEWNKFLDKYLEFAEADDNQDADHVVYNFDYISYIKDNGSRCRQEYRQYKLRSHSKAKESVEIDIEDIDFDEILNLLRRCQCEYSNPTVQREAKIIINKLENIVSLIGA